MRGEEVVEVGALPVQVEGDSVARSRPSLGRDVEQIRLQLANEDPFAGTDNGPVDPSVAEPRVIDALAEGEVARKEALDESPLRDARLVIHAMRELGEADVRVEGADVPGCEHVRLL